MRLPDYMTSQRPSKHDSRPDLVFDKFQSPLVKLLNVFEARVCPSHIEALYSLAHKSVSLSFGAQLPDLAFLIRGPWRGTPGGDQASTTSRLLRADAADNGAAGIRQPGHR